MSENENLIEGLRQSAAGEVVDLGSFLDDVPGDRGFLHDVRTVLTEDGWMAVIEREEEEDGNPSYNVSVEIACEDVTQIPGYDADDLEDAQHGHYFETDPDLPQWLYNWAEPIIDASKDTDAYRAHAAEWIGPDGDWT